MEENKQLIYRGEVPTETDTGAVDEVETLEIPEIVTVPPQVEIPAAAPVRSHRGWMGLMIGVTVFAMAFLLCDAAHTLRTVGGGEGERADWLAQLLLGTTATAGQSMMPSLTEEPPETVTPGPTETSSSVTASPTGTSSSMGMTSSETTPPAPTLTAEELYTYDTAAVPSGMIPIVPMDLSLSSYGESFYYNDTSYVLSPGTGAGDVAIPTVAGAVSEDVSVLILHTHATEGYSGEGATYYDPSTTLARADDPSTGVIAVGQVMADILNARGIKTVHSTVLHDETSYKDSYSRAAATIGAYLEQYPSIRLVIDVHRDSIMTSADKLVRPVTLVEGEAVAQVMCVVGSDAAGISNPNWQDDFNLAVSLRNRLNERYGNLARPVYVKKSAYNQQYAPASLLLEVGSSGNTLAEAKRTAILVAEEIAQMMK